MGKVGGNGKERAYHREMFVLYHEQVKKITEMKIGKECMGKGGGKVQRCRKEF